MNVWYAFLNALGIRMFEMDFMKNALLAVLLLGPLFGLLSTMIVTGKMSFFSDALGHSGFTGIAIGVLCGAVQPIYFAVGLSVLFALLFSFVRSRTSQSADTIIGVFSSTAVALGIFIVTLGGRSFTKFNRYLIGDILSVSPQEIGLLALVLATWTTNVTNAYSGGLALSNLLGFDESKFKITTGIAGAVGTLLAAFGVLSKFEAFLNLMSALLPPLAGVIIANYWIVGKGRRDAFKIHGGVFAPGLIAYLVGAFGNLFTGNIHGAVDIVSLVFAFAFLALIIFMLVRPYKEATKLASDVKVTK